MDANTNRIQFKDSKSLKKLQERHESPSLAAKTALSRYFYLLEDAVKRLDFSEKEIHLIVDAMNGWRTTDDSPHPELLRGGLHLNVYDAIEMNELDKKWKVNGKAVLAKLKSLSEIEAIALIDAVEMFWYDPSYRIEDTDEKLKKVNLIRGKEGKK